MTQQLDTESRVARRIRFQSPRRQRRDLPAGRCRAGLGRHGGAQQQGRRSRTLSRQRQPPARGQVEPARLPPGLDQHRSQRRTAGRLATCPQHPLRIARPHQQDASRIKPEFGQAGRVQTAGLDIDDILPDPKDRTQPGRPDGQPDREPRRRREIGRGRRIDLVQRRPSDAATQRPVEAGCAEADLPDGSRHATQRHLREVAAQIGQGERVRLGSHEGSCSIFVLL